MSARLAALAAQLAGLGFRVLPGASSVDVYPVSLGACRVSLDRRRIVASRKTALLIPSLADLVTPASPSLSGLLDVLDAEEAVRGWVGGQLADSDGVALLLHQQLLWGTVCESLLVFNGRPIGLAAAGLDDDRRVVLHAALDSPTEPTDEALRHLIGDLYVAETILSNQIGGRLGRLYRDLRDAGRPAA